MVRCDAGNRCNSLKQKKQLPQNGGAPRRPDFVLGYPIGESAIRPDSDRLRKEIRCRPGKRRQRMQEEKANQP
jgi:hypothetical protein